MSDALNCPKCGTPYKRNQLSCMKCNFLLFDPKASTVHIRVDPGLLRLRRTRDLLQADEANTAERMIHLQIRGLTEKLAFEEETEIVLGRVDLANPDPGRFDLTPFGGHERGVSRAHALLRYRDNQFTVTDLNSANGTTVNQKRLLPNEPLMLHDGDQLMLGSLSIGVRLDPKPLLRKTGPLTMSNSPSEPSSNYETPSKLPLSTLPKTAVLGEASAAHDTTMPHRPANLPDTPLPDMSESQTKQAAPPAAAEVKIDSSTKPVPNVISPPEDKPVVAAPETKPEGTIKPINAPPLSTAPSPPATVPEGTAEAKFDVTTRRIDTSMVTPEGRLVIPAPEPQKDPTTQATPTAPSPPATVPEGTAEVATEPTPVPPPSPPASPEVKPNPDNSAVEKSSS